MAICGFCNQDMSSNKVDTCTGNDFVEYPNGEKLESVPYNFRVSDFEDAIILGEVKPFPPNFKEEDKRCHDCNIKNHGKHHPGCDMEECPRCGGQLISCGCLDEEEDEERSTD